jgi:hypothetical protein
VQADEHWCVLCPEAQFIWLFGDRELSKAQGLVGAFRPPRLLILPLPLARKCPD